MSPRHIKKYDGLSGPTYTIGDKGVKYTLPPPGVLKVSMQLQDMIDDLGMRINFFPFNRLGMK